MIYQLLVGRQMPIGCLGAVCFTANLWLKRQNHPESPAKSTGTNAGSRPDMSVRITRVKWITRLGVIPSLIIMRLGFGLSTAPLYPTCGRMNLNWIPLWQRGRVQGVVTAGSGFGGAVAPVLFAWMIAAIGWRASFLAAAAATAALGAAWFSYVRDRPGQHPLIRESLDVPLPEVADRVETHKPTPWRALLTDKNLIFLTLGYFAVGYFQYIFFYWMYYYLGDLIIHFTLVVNQAILGLAPLAAKIGAIERGLSKASGGVH